MTAGRAEATQALAHRLRSWGIDEAEEKASEFIGALIWRGWVLDLKAVKVPRPPKAGEECATHPTEWRVNCRSCSADRKAIRDEEAERVAQQQLVTKEQAIADARAAIKAASTPVPDEIRKAAAGHKEDA